MHIAMSANTWFVVLGAALLAWLFGAVYYTALSGVWLKAQGRTLEAMKVANAHKSNAAKAFPFILSLIAEIAMAAVMTGLLRHMSMLTLRGGIISGVLVWFGFVLTTVWVNNAYPGRSTMLTAIDSAHWLGVLVIIGAMTGGLG